MGLLNDFITEKCTKQMTSIDFYVCLLKWSCKRLRIIESKHNNEGMGKGQRQFYEFLAKIFGFLNKHSRFGWRFDVMIVRGEPPYDEISVHDLVDNKEFFIKGQKEVIRFLSLEY